MTEVEVETQHRKLETGTQGLRTPKCSLQREQQSDTANRNNIRSQNPRDPSNLYHRSGPSATDLSQPLFQIQTRVCWRGPRPKTYWYMHQILHQLQHATIPTWLHSEINCCRKDSHVLNIDSLNGCCKLFCGSDNHLTMTWQHLVTCWHPNAWRLRFECDEK